MAFNSDTWKKIRNSSDIYGSLTDENRKKFWEYGTSNGLVDFQNITPENKSKLQSKYGVTQDTYVPKYLLMKDSEDGKTKQSAEIRKDELRYKERASGQVETGVVKTGDKGKAVISNQEEINDYADKIKDMTPTQLAEYKKTKKPPVPKFVQGTKTTFTPIVPYTTTPIRQGITQTQSPTTVPTTDSRFSLANRQQNLKESSLEPQKPTVRNPFTYKDTTQGSRGTLTAEAQQIARENTPAIISGALGGLGKTFGIRNTAEQEAYLRQQSPSAFKLNFGGTATIPRQQGEEAETMDFGPKRTVDVSQYDIADLGGQIVGQVAGYGLVNKLIQGSGLGLKLTQALAKKVGKPVAEFATSQGAQLLADAIIQAPVEAFEVITNDKSLPEDFKQILINRGIDLAFNSGLGVLEILKSKQAVKMLNDAGVPEKELIDAVQSNDQQAIREIQNRVNIKGKEYEVSKGTAQGSIPITETKPSLTVASGQKVVKSEFTLKKPTENLYTPTQPRDVFSIEDRSITNVSKTNLKPYSQQNAEVVPFYKEAAKDLKADLLQTVKGQQSGGLVRVPDGRGSFNDRYVDTSTSREASESVTELLETLPSNPTYKQIEESLDRIATGQSKNALDKQIEVILDKRLTKGFRAIDGTQVRPDGAYINAKALGEFEATAPPIRIESPLAKRTLTKVPTVTTRKELPKLQPTLKQSNVFKADERTIKELESEISNPYLDTQKVEIPKEFAGKQVLLRVDENKTLAMPEDKPHGLYMSFNSDGKSIYTPHMNEYGESASKHFVEPDIKKPLVIGSEYANAKNSRDGLGYSAGVSAVKKLDSVNFDRLNSMNKSELTNYIASKYPDIKGLDKYYDSNELMEVLGARLAKDNGYDSIILKEGGSTDEVVLLKNNTIKSQPTPKLTASMGKEPVKLEGYTLVKEPKKITPTLKPKVEAPKVEAPKTDDELVKSFSEKVSGDPAKKKRKPFKQTVLDLRKEFEDDWLEIESLEKRVRGKVSSAEKSPYAQGRLYRGAPEKANEFIRTELAPVIDRIVAKGGIQEDLSNYALAVHARDVNNAGMKSGMSNEEINAVIKKYGTPDMEQARKELVGVSNKALDELLASGRISKESVDSMRKKWPNYMPLSRSFDDDKVDFAVGLSQAFSNVSNPIKVLKGSDRVVIDPIESMTKNIYRITDAAERNKVGVQLAKLAKEADDSIIRKLKPGEEIGRKNVVTVYVDGKKAQYEVEPEVYKAFVNFDKESSNMIMNWISKPASVLRAGATLTPDFALRNPFRDIQTAFVVSKSGFNPLLDFPAGLASVLKKDELYSSWLKEGGGYGNIASMDRQAHKQALENVLKQPISKKFVNVITPKGFMAMLRSISDVTEAATKVGEYKAALRSGATPAEAAFRSRDLMDFARAGYSVRQWNRVTAFMNASIQGKSKLIRAIADNPTAVMTRMATSMVLPTVAISLANYQFASEEQKKIIDDAPDWLKDSFWLIAVPGTDLVARFPKPFDIAVVANGTERFLDYAMNKDKEAFDGFAKSTAKSMSIPLMITGLLPMLEATMNYSLFREGPIIPMSESYREKKDQYDTKTSHVGRALAGVVGNFAPESNFASPRIMDYVLKSSTAGLGQYGMDATDFIANGLSKDKGPVKPSLRIEQAPVAKAFLVSPFTSGKSVDFVYSTKDKLSKEKSSAKFNDVEFSGQKQAMLDYANEQTKMLTDISKSIKEVEKSTTMTSGQKRDEIVRLTKERNQIAQDSADYIKKFSAK